MIRNVTLLELVMEITRTARDEAELIATVVALVNGDRVRLCGSFRDAHFDPSALRR